MDSRPASIAFRMFSGRSSSSSKPSVQACWRSSTSLSRKSSPRLSMIRLRSSSREGNPMPPRSPVASPSFRALAIIAGVSWAVPVSSLREGPNLSTRVDTCIASRSGRKGWRNLAATLIALLGVLAGLLTVSGAILGISSTAGTNPASFRAFRLRAATVGGVALLPSGTSTPMKSFRVGFRCQVTCWRSCAVVVATSGATILAALDLSRAMLLATAASRR